MFMSLVEELKMEGKIEGKMEGKMEERREIAIEMLKDGMEINQIVRFTRLPEAEVLKLKKQVEAGKK
jgi:predicted transposase YdaD